MNVEDSAPKVHKNYTNGAQKIAQRVRLLYCYLCL